METAKDDSARMATLHSILSSADIDDSYAEAERILTKARVGHRRRSYGIGYGPCEGERRPTQLCIGSATVYGIEIAAVPDVLIPRDETELFGWEAVVRMREKYGPAGRGARIIDMRCGSRNLACRMAHALSEAEVWATDLMEDCAALMARNAQRLGFEKRIHISAGDLFVPLAKAGRKYDTYPPIRSVATARTSSAMSRARPLTAGPRGFLSISD